MTDLVLFFAVIATAYVWLALEVVLLVRDGVRGMGSTGRDRGSRRLNFLVIVVTIVVAEVVAVIVPDAKDLTPRSCGPETCGLPVGGGHDASCAVVGISARRG